MSTLHDFRYLTSTMLALLFWGRISSAAAARLKLLHDAGFLEKFRPRVRRSEGSREWVYRLSEQGWHDVVLHNPPTDGDHYRPAALTSISYVEHDLEVAALVVHIALLAARGNGWNGSAPLIHTIPFELVGPRAGTIAAGTPHGDQTLSGTRTRADKHVNLGRSVAGNLAPDATLIGTDRHGRKTAVMLEYDRTRRAHKQGEKFRRYDRFLTATWQTTRYRSLDLEPVVLFICTHEQQVASFLSVADRHLTASRGDPRAFPEQREFTGREQVAVTSRDRLLSADWRLCQVPHSPRPRSPQTHRIEVELPLPALFKREPAVDSIAPMTGPRNRGL